MQEQIGLRPIHSPPAAKGKLKEGQNGLAPTPRRPDL